MADKICRITIFAFMLGDIPKGKENGYDDDDLKNGIEWCQELIDNGYEIEPMDSFNLKDYIKWAKDLLNKE